MSTQSTLFAAFEHVITDSDLSQSVIDALDDLDDDAFLSVILRRLDPLPTNKAIWRALCHPTLVDRTLGCLEELAEEMAADIKRRALTQVHGKAKQLGIVKSRILMANGAATREPARAAVHARIEADREMTRQLLRRLTLAVNAHRLACIDLNLAPEPHDLALWETLDELRLPGEGQEGAGPSLAEQIAAGRWYHADVSTPDTATEAVTR